MTLLRADDAGGPYAPVPDGSSIMAPNNRSNPSTSDSAGRFGWDVLAGYYKVTASKPGCVNPDNHSETSVSTGVLTVPPPVTDVSLKLDCNPPPPVAVGKIEGLRARALGNGAIKLIVRTSGAGRVTAKGRTRIKLGKRKRAHRAHGAHGKRGKASKKRRGGRSRTKWVGYGSGNATLAAAGKATFVIHPSKRAKKLLKSRRRLKVPVRALFAPSPSGDSSSKTARVTVHYTRKHKKKQGHHNKRHHR